MQEPSDLLDDSLCPPGASGLSVSQDLQVCPGPPGLPVSPASPSSPGPLPSPSPPSLSEPAVPPGPPGPPVLTSPPKRLRHERTLYSKEQQRQLERLFQMKKYPNFQERWALAERIQVKEHQVQVWFKNRRARARASPQQAVQPLPGKRHSQVFPEAPAFRRSVPCPSGVFSAANPDFSSHSSALAGPRWGALGVPSANAAAWPQDPHAPYFMPGTKLLPYFTEFLSPQDPFGEPLVPAKTPEYPVGGGVADKDRPGPGHD